MLAVAIMVMALSQAATPAPSTPATAVEIPVNVEHIREGLKRPPTLKIPPIDSTPVFRATVTEAPFENPLQGMRRELAEDSGTPIKCGPCNTGHSDPLIQRDVLPLIMGIVHSIKAAHRAREEAVIRTEVQAALNAFCAEHDCSVLEDGASPMEGIVLPRSSRGRP